VKVLLTADLYYRPGWFDWLEDEAHKYALISIAGDLLDMFSGLPLGDQLVHVKDSLHRLAEKVPVAVCSGNHDAVDVVPLLLPGVAVSYAASWLEEMTGTSGLIGDGQMRPIGGRLIVTTIPFFSRGGWEQALLEEGKRLKAERGAPWLLITHDPARIQAAISRASPDFVHFGHYHGRDGFSRRSGNTLFLCAGQRLEAAIPNHIVLDAETGIAAWRFS
jgi:predicted MPP superfamily phosphohydrolase